MMLVLAQFWQTPTYLPDDPESAEDSTHIFNGGNPLTVNISDYAELFGDLFDKFAQVYRKCSVWNYRQSDSSNRHGHCNSCPSPWARGLTFDAFRKSLGGSYSAWKTQIKKELQDKLRRPPTSVDIQENIVDVAYVKWVESQMGRDEYYKYTQQRADNLPHKKRHVARKVIWSPTVIGVASE